MNNNEDTSLAPPYHVRGRGKRISIPIGVSVVTKREISPVFWLKMGWPDTVPQAPNSS
jgi:hypothetical protein